MSVGTLTFEGLKPEFCEQSAREAVNYLRKLEFAKGFSSKLSPFINARNDATTVAVCYAPLS